MKLIIEDLIKIRKKYLEEDYRDLLEKFSVFIKKMIIIYLSKSRK